MIYRLLLLGLLALSIWGLYDARRKKAAFEDRSSAAVATLPAAIVGFAIQDSVGQWCVGTTRTDIKPGWNLHFLWPQSHETADATLGEPRTPCTQDTINGERSFALAAASRMPSSEPAVVLGRVYWTTKDSSYVGEFDSKPGEDRIAACSDYEYLYLVVSNLEPGRDASFFRRLPRETGADECAGDLERIVADRMPLEPLVYPAWAYRMDRYSPHTKWLLLNGNALAKANVDVVEVEGACGDTTNTIAPASGGDYVALFGNLSLTEGPVQVANATPPFVTDGYGDPDSTIVVLGGDTLVVRRVHGAGILVTADDQTLFESDFEDEGRASVEWAGDLDRDGKADLLMMTTPKYSVRAAQLHLSTQRTSTSWPAAATFSQAGC